MADDNVSLRALVHGRVQGVGFRFFVQDTAVSHGIRGYARNLDNGSVEIVAEGTRTALESLLAELRRGPSLSRVDHVDASWEASPRGYAGFEIK